ncbi:hypothetical protein [Cupriavidus sp. TMH.W2]|uniref:hypothetical protein n=1 Tax=Cupriavidus sp. TMH.W2 TaxID=3434465 RepID=UPI003D783A2E
MSLCSAAGGGLRRPVETGLKFLARDEQVKMELPGPGLEVIVEQAGVAQVIFFEDSSMLEICLKEGSRISLHCTFETAQSLAVELLPEARDHDFLFHARSGDRYCAWDDLR